MSIESVMPSNHLILCLPLLLPPSTFPASGSFLVSQFFVSSGQSIGVSASASVLPINIQNSFPLAWTGLISLQSKDSQESFPTPQFKSINFSALSFLYLSTKVRLVKAMVFPVVMYGCESWNIKQAKHSRSDASELWCWRRLLRVPWAARRSN